MGKGFNVYKLFEKREDLIRSLLEKYNCIKYNDVDGDKTSILCNCKRWVTVDEIVDIVPIDVNTFNWWSYKLTNYNDFMNNKSKNIVLSKKHKPYNYIAYIPLIREIPYYLHKWFHKPDYALSIDCKYCEEDDNE